MRFFIVAITLLFSSTAWSQATNWIPFENANGHVMIKVNVAGVDSYAIIDSGSQINALNLAFAEHHGMEFSSNKRIKIKGAHSVEERRVYREVPTKLLGLDLQMELVGLDLGASEVSMLLGAPLLNQFILQFDYPNSRLRFANPGTFNLKETANLEMRAQEGSGRPLVRVNLNDEAERWLLLDTGNSGGIYMDRMVAISQDWVERFPLAEGVSRGVNASKNVQFFQLPLFGFGPYKLENVQVVVPAEGSPADFGRRYQNVSSRMRGVEISGVLGYDILKHFILTIDYRNGYGHVYVPQ
ncbi:hypothetical protein [Pseudidiomarina insulisalsae]|uniref:Signal protein PDZ n=1 Tax=Pseudidiomarina insulisalsae TaxID=575789 RepID=A0A432YM81_9GAMM|nr:hypothetical protein [Pseudidiomarina insulisalsae]RUO62074.1 hypothetical protein CWI71_04280 [Pseudidiomarina insulisalsae]